MWLQCYNKIEGVILHMLKVIAINSSSRKMNTYKIIVQVKEILRDNNIDVEIINLFDYDIKACIGCEHCKIMDGKRMLHSTYGGC